MLGRLSGVGVWPVNPSTSLLMIFFPEVNLNSLTPIFRLAVLINEQNYAPADSSPSEGKIIVRTLPRPTSTDNRAEWYQKP
jgi:hypothetical protein